MNKKRKLLNTELKKIFLMELTNLKIVYQTGKIEKPRTYQKEFKSEEEALKFFYKKEWEMLKKGFVLNNEDATFGNPKLHYFTSGGYTGCLSFTNTTEGIFVYQHGCYDNPKDEHDFIVNIDKFGTLINKIRLPETLPWDIQFNAKKGCLLINLDHHIYTFDIEKESFQKIADRESKWGGFISISKQSYAYGTNEQLVVKDFEDNTLFNKDYKPEIINASPVFCAKLSKSNILAIHTKPGEIELYFKVQHWKDERRILNCHPEDENFQKGITVVTSSNDGGSQRNFYLPNNLNYTEFKIIDKNIEITTSKKNIRTNLTELSRKLHFFKLSITENEIEAEFKNLCNEWYEKQKKLEVKTKNIVIPSFGKLMYNKDIKWYEGEIEIENQKVGLCLYNAEPKKLKKLISFTEKQLQSKFYEQMLFKMENKMIDFKNHYWLEENEDEITVNDFRNRISITSIIFYNDCSSSIECNDNDIFWGHTIEINMDKKGEYKDVNLVG